MQEPSDDALTPPVSTEIRRPGPIHDSQTWIPFTDPFTYLDPFTDHGGFWWSLYASRTWAGIGTMEGKGDRTGLVLIPTAQSE